MHFSAQELRQRQSVNIQAETRRIAPGDGCWSTRVRRRHRANAVSFFYETSKPAPALRLHQQPLLGKETLSLNRLIVRTIILQSPQPRLLLLTRGFVFFPPPTTTTTLLWCVSRRLDSHTEIISKVMSGSDAFMWNNSKCSAINYRRQSVNEWFE